MTVIAAIKDKKGKIYIAADRRQSEGMHKGQPTLDPKVIKRYGLLLAGTGSMAAINLLVRAFKIPSYKGMSADNYMYNKFVPKFRKYIDSHKLQGPILDAQILVACKGRLYSVLMGPEGVALNTHSLPYATGCGGLIAWGALIESEDSTRTPEDRLHRAVQAAARVSPGCDANVDIVKE